MPRTIHCLVASIVLVLMLSPGSAMAASSPAAGRALADDARFYAPPPNPGALRQIESLSEADRDGDAALILAMVSVPQAVWFTSGTPGQVERSVRKTIRLAADERRVPVLVAYDVPGRDCGGYSAGGAQTPADYAAWVDGW